jgi:hypothetical protein
VFSQNCCDVNDPPLTSPHRVSVACGKTIDRASVSVAVLMASGTLSIQRGKQWRQAKFWVYNLTIYMGLGVWRFSEHITWQSFVS